jgi:hypothetical protein
MKKNVKVVFNNGKALRITEDVYNQIVGGLDKGKIGIHSWSWGGKSYLTINLQQVSYITVN